MDFPNISKQRGASHQYSSRGGGLVPVPASSSHHYYGSADQSSATADGLWSAGSNHDAYRYAPAAARESTTVAPYRHQSRSRRPSAAPQPEEPAAGRRTMPVLDRVPSDRNYDTQMKPTSRMVYSGDFAGGSGGGGARVMYPDRYDTFSPGPGKDDHFYPAVQDHYNGGARAVYPDRYDTFSPGRGMDDDFYPAVQGHYNDNHYHGKSMYDPEIPSLVGSDHSSFEIASDDDEENGWDRKIRPEEKLSMMNGYFSEEENDAYYARPVQKSRMPPRPPLDDHDGYYTIPQRQMESRMTTPQQLSHETDDYHARSAKARIPSVVAVAPNAAAAVKPRIEVAPGEWLPLRGATETWAAVQNDFYMPTECVCCRSMIFCIQDAAFVLCPTCKVVSPGFSDDPSAGGVGLGFTMEELAKWQTDIERSRKEAAKQRM